MVAKDTSSTMTCQRLLGYGPCETCGDWRTLHGPDDRGHPFLGKQRVCGLPITRESGKWWHDSLTIHDKHEVVLSLEDRRSLDLENNVAVVRARVIDLSEGTREAISAVDFLIAAVEERTRFVCATGRS